MKLTKKSCNAERAKHNLTAFLQTIRNIRPGIIRVYFLKE